MTDLTLVLLGLSLSIDSLAVAVTTGICKQKVRLRHALKAGLVFAFFQVTMPLAGWVAGVRIHSLMASFDHWLAFGLLALIGGRMIYEAVREIPVSPDADGCVQTAVCPAGDPTSWGRLAGLGLATSIDALAAGVSLAIDHAPIVPALFIIGVITFLFAFTGMMAGKRLGVLFQRRACIAGGCILILIGFKILLEHLVLA